MKVWSVFLCAGILFFVSTLSVSAQSEGGGGGVKPSTTSDSTYKRKFRAPTKRSAPKRIAPMTTAAAYEAQGDKYYEAKDYDSALVAYQSAAKLKPSFNSLYHIGWLQNDFGQYSDAVAALNRAIAIDGSQARAYTEKGYAHRRLNQFDQAIDAFEQSISLYPEGYIAPYELGSLYNEQKRYDEAEGYLLKSLKNKADNANAYEELGAVQRRQGRSADAIRSFNKAIQLDPSDSGPYMGLGDVYFYNTKEYQKSVDPYLKGLELEPDNQVAAYNVGYSYNDVGRYADALTWLQKAVQLKPSYVEARSEIGFAQLKLKRYNEAVATLRTAITASPDFDNSHYYLGQVYVLMGNKTGANNEYRELKRLDSQYASKLLDMINKSDVY